MPNSTKAGLRVLVCGLEQPDPEMIAAAWDAWRPRHNGKLGPGPAFVEAITAANRVLLSRARASGIPVNEGGEQNAQG
ncbi:hypothetical protein FF100_04605 [Methylobacterium terricola]|uniref:Uncharacterized protein n=1 Tax=Methylobacterium terricola TaxID=2583531 RepID=A0A5C4LLE0_9HYPH|nr:hypothetical protein [Methylobacterium terricola]TNC14863.1 hypothetical protein FF100_04605 [Methylobacterium terricola]